MIIRYHLKCAGCQSKIVLRLNIGVDSIQPFYFICQKCGAPTKGIHKIDYEQDSPSPTLTLEDAKLIDTYWEKPDQTITIAPDLPCIITPDDNATSKFPFLYQKELMENGYALIEYQNRIGDFRDLIEADWSKYRRLISYYLDRNWKQFDKEIKNIFGKRVPKSATELDRHDVFERSLNLLFVYIQPDESYLDLLQEINDFVTAVSVKDMHSLLKFSHSIEEKELVDLQAKLLERLSFMVENFSALSPAFPILFYSPDNKSKLAQIRIMRDDFEILKSHYLSCFEISYKVLKLIVGMINVFSRGDGDLFPNGKPKSLEKFAKLPNPQKLDFVDSVILPEITTQWDSFFDRNIRNAIGHYGIRHDLKTGMLIHDDDATIPYSEFVLKNLELLPLLQFCLHVIKKIYAIKIILGESKN